MQIYKKNPQSVFVKYRKTAIVILLTLISPLLFSQSISSSQDKVTLKQALNIVEKRANMLFAYSNDNLNLSQLVEIPKQGASVNAMLDQVLKNTGCTYQLRGNYILISKMPEPALQPQEKKVIIPKVESKPIISGPMYVTIHGVVLDDKTGLALSGVTLKMIEGAKKDVFSDSEGRFVFTNVTEGKATILALHNDYAAQELDLVVTTNADKNLVIRLKRDQITIMPTDSKMKLDDKWSFYSPNENTRFGKSYTRGGSFAIKTNLLYSAATLTPNLGIEFGLGQKSTMELSGSYNPWNLEGKVGDNKKFVHWIARAEYRYWLCERFNGHFFGAHGLYSQYNISGYDFPMMFEKAYRYEGYAVGGGITYGYNLMLGKRWGMEFSVGAGMVFTNYDKHTCEWCGDELGDFNKTYFGPTKAGISLVYLIK